MEVIKLVAFVILTLANGVLLQKTVNNEVLRMVSSWSDNGHMDRTLKEILRPRVVNTSSHEYVKTFIINELTDLGMTVELDEFRNHTPYGPIKFTNIVARLNPSADKYLTLACHYDSKYFKDFEFLAATDSAVPCAIMLNLLHTLGQTYLDDMKKRKDLSLMLIFFDGEEALVDWTPDDSLYGSRHLAQKWETQFSKDSTGNTVSNLERIELFVLLDLIGASNNRFVSLVQKTHPMHMQMYSIERSLGRLKKLQGGNFIIDRSKIFYGQIEDDHLPFMNRGVSVLHLISTPFPRNWHKAGDNYENLSWPVINNFNEILRVFVYNHLK